MLYSDVEKADEAAFAAEEAAGGAGTGAVFNLPPGISNPNALTSRPPAGFKAFAPVNVDGAVSGDFFPSPKFMGARPGYYFSSGPHGIGYYIDSNGDPSLRQRVNAQADVGTSSSNREPVKRKAPPKGPPPAWALEGNSIAPA